MLLEDVGARPHPATLVAVIHLHDPETGSESLRPLEIIDKGPIKITENFDFFIPGPLDLGQVAFDEA